MTKAVTAKGSAADEPEHGQGAEAEHGHAAGEPSMPSMKL
jgi:hypothetical protein